MSEISVTLPDGSSRRVPAGSTPARRRGVISPRLAKAALAAVVDDRLVDLTFPLRTDANVQIVTADAPDALPLYRHSTAHLLAAAVTNLFPSARSAASARRPTRASSTTSSLTARSCPRISTPSRRR